MCRTTAEIQQVDAARLTWVDTNNKMEAINFQTPHCNSSRVTLEPSSPVLILKQKLYYTCIVLQSTDMPPIVVRYSNDS